MVSKLLKIVHAPPLLVTFKHAFKEAFTIQYPEERRELPERSRGLHTYDADRCMGCGACARACPNNCIELEVSTTPDGKKKIDKFDIYLGRCMFCGLCVDHCIGKGVLSMTTGYEYSEHDRKSLIYGIDRLAKKEEAKEVEKIES
jgi:NADH-quinone oxidoreductase chain I